MHKILSNQVKTNANGVLGFPPKPLNQSLKCRFLRALVFSWSLFSLLGSPSVNAGVFTLPQFLDPGEAQLGVEPEFVFTNRGGPGIQGRFAYGVNDLSNLHLWVGSGSDPRGFRSGGIYSFDFIPDIDGQIGAGIGLGGQYLNHPQWNRWDFSVVPYVHEGLINSSLPQKRYRKTASRKSDSNGARQESLEQENLKGVPSEEEVESVREESITEPFLAFPIGYSRIDGRWEVSTTFVIGSLFHATSYLTYVLEFGINVNYTETYLSGGLAFQF